ncbi:cobalt ABC transporter ATP-binding protein [Escherichia sp. E4385]|uniref:cobalt ABC transporter ATP-binding protein n=1 Tax=Escherichia sp. E4385 TaxID=2040639 RepID=UPI00197A9429|nr:cobalt ABC transporter ATP-binding protein [Escherichia sp. E4385]
MTRNRAERRHHMARLKKKSAVVIAQQAMKAKKHQVFAFVLPVFVLVGCVGIDAIIMVPAYRKFVQKHAMRIKGK